MILSTVEFFYYEIGPDGFATGNELYGTMRAWSEDMVFDVEVLVKAERAMKKYHPERICSKFKVISMETVAKKHVDCDKS